MRWIWLIVGASLVAHGWCLGSVFFLDDIPHIRDNPYVRTGDWWEVPRYLRWTYLWYWIQFEIWGDWSVGYHMVNWLLHTAGALVFYRVAYELSGKARVALLGSLLFVVHPLTSEITNYARCQDLAWVNLFSFLSCWGVLRWLQTKSWSDMAWIFGGLIGAMFSKGPGLFHALMMMGMVGVVQMESLQLRRIHLRWFLTVVVFTGGLYFSGLLQSWLGGVSKWGSPEMGWHAVTLCRVFWEFVALFFYPNDLCADHFVAATWTWDDPKAVLAVAGLLTWSLVSLVLLWWRKTRVLGACLFLFAGAMLLRMGYLMNEYMPEYRIYPGLAWGCLAMAILAQRLNDRVWAIVLILLTSRSAIRSFDWHQLETLCADVLEQYPFQGRAHWMLQRADAENAEWEKVIERFERFEEIENAFLEENQRLAPGRALSGGHQNLSQLANYGYYCQALAGVGKGQEAVMVLSRLHPWVERPGVAVGDRRLLRRMLKRFRSLTLEQMGRYEEALRELEDVPGRNVIELDRARIRKKLSVQQ